MLDLLLLLLPLIVPPDPLPPPVPGLSTSTWNVGIGLPLSEVLSILPVDNLPTLLFDVTLGFDGIRKR